MKIPYKFLVLRADSSGRTIVDSGSTITFMEKPVFEAMAQGFESQMENYTRAKDVETKMGLRPCFDILKEEKLEFPNLVFQFKRGAKMELPLTNYFSLVSSSGLKWLMEDSIEEPKNVDNNDISVRLRVKIEELYMLWKQKVEKGMSLQYVVKCEHWRDLALCFEERVLIPRPETELIVDLVGGVVLGNKGLREGLWADFTKIPSTLWSILTE
ncbi:aspartic proteinase nepenthesin-1 [Pyrus ussuriensis x Pyrus communis]|uniref:Aspartic proteinase nepenthesin-1 n=1 Tax=Pyrus ussuriensis x Pyrus communis TaxID=2448454 RepID=A0A5N5GYR6_9ROSA|nr:aspartic proteinase nepenthesin-1 [Pyrus ussuriensis x Pyrus communis]